MNARIPFNRPALAGRESDYMRDALVRGKISGDGHYSRLCQELLGRELGGASVLLTASGTQALELAGLVLKLQPGDEFIIPAFASVSTANAFVIRGARPVFADIRPDTLNLDERQLEALITPRTKAIVVEHYAGVGCEMDTVLPMAARHGIPVVEDNAHGMFGAYRGRPLGSFGCLATQSFHETKNITCGEGGALAINDPRYLERAEVLREKGTDRARCGSSYVLADCLAAFLYAQLENRRWIQSVRDRIWNRYSSELTEWAAAYGISLPHVPDHCRQPYSMFYLLMPSLADRQALLARLESRGILAACHYVPLHTAPMGLRLGGRPGMCPVTESAASRIVRLPFHYGLKEPEQLEVIRAVREFRPARADSLVALSRAMLTKPIQVPIGAAYRGATVS